MSPSFKPAFAAFPFADCSSRPRSKYRLPSKRSLQLHRNNHLVREALVVRSSSKKALNNSPFQDRGEGFKTYYPITSPRPYSLLVVFVPRHTIRIRFCIDVTCQQTASQGLMKCFRAYGNCSQVAFMHLPRAAARTHLDDQPTTRC